MLKFLGTWGRQQLTTQTQTDLATQLNKAGSAGRSNMAILAHWLNGFRLTLLGTLGIQSIYSGL